MSTNSQDHDSPTRTARRISTTVDERSTKPALQPGDRVARYQVLGSIGSGGMATVYAAYDPHLDRKVALKLLHTANVVGDPRLVREAQALARLSHPNVVTVHEVDVHDERMFVAMEFVPGSTLKQWLQQGKRLSERLSVLIEAGEGLAAAHRAGLVHRDFKPGNVIVGDDGRVRVLDFGLVRVEGAPSPDERGATAEHSVDELGESAAEVVLTRSGAVMGTPAYMAPEQFHGRTADARTDQFGFCVTAWETIFGMRPFSGSTPMAVLEAIAKPPERPGDIDCPEPLEAALRKGFAQRPGRRHRDLDAVLDALRQAQATLAGARPRPRRRRWLGAGVVLVAAVGTVAFVAQQDKACTGAEQHLSELWGPQRRAEMEQAFAATDAPFADSAWGSFSEQLDGYTDEWAAGFRDACEASQVRKEQSSALMDLRMACLDDRRNAVEALLDVYAEPSVQMVANAYDAFGTLPAIESCADVDYVRRDDPEPDVDPQERARVRRMVQEARTLGAAGKYDEALSAVNNAVAASDELGSARVRAHAYGIRGALDVYRDDFRGASDDLHKSFLLAVQSKDFDQAGKSAVDLTILTGENEYHRHTAQWWSEAALYFANETDSIELLAKALMADGARLAKLDPGAATDRYERSRRLYSEQGQEPNLSHATATRRLAEVVADLGDAPRAQSLAREALEEALTLLGPSHPRLSLFHQTASGVALHGGKHRDAIQHANAAIDLVTTTSEATPTRLLTALITLGLAQLREDPRAARSTLEDAAALADVEGADPKNALSAYLALGNAHFQLHEYSPAETRLAKAVELSRAELGELHVQTASARIALASAISEQGRQEEALIILRAGMAAGAQIFVGPGADDRFTAIANVFKNAGKLVASAEYFERALAIGSRTSGEQGDRTAWHLNLCGIYGQLGRTSDAIDQCKRALAASNDDTAFNADHKGGLHNNLGAAYAADKRWADSIGAFQEAKRHWTEAHGAESPAVAIATANIAEAHAALGRNKRAEALYREAIATLEKTLGESHPRLVFSLLGASALATDRGDAAEGRTLARRALGLAEDAGHPLKIARAQEALARALWSSPSKRREATKLIGQASAAFEAAGTEAEGDRERLAQWWDADAKTPR